MATPVPPLNPPQVTPAVTTAAVPPFGSTAAAPLAPAVGAAVKSGALKAATVGAVSAPEMGTTIGNIAGALSKAGRNYRKQLNEDRAKLNSNTDLGFTDAQKRQKLGAAMMAAQTGQDAQMAELSRQAAAGGGFGRNPQMVAAQGAIADAAAGQVGAQLQSIEAQSEARAAAEQARIRAEDEAQRERVKAGVATAATGLIKGGAALATGGTSTLLDDLLLGTSKTPA